MHPLIIARNLPFAEMMARPPAWQRGAGDVSWTVLWEYMRASSKLRVSLRAVRAEWKVLQLAQLLDALPSVALGFSVA